MAIPAAITPTSSSSSLTKVRCLTGEDRPPNDDTALSPSMRRLFASSLRYTWPLQQIISFVPPAMGTSTNSVPIRMLISVARPGVTVSEP